MKSRINWEVKDNLFTITVRTYTDSKEPGLFQLTRQKRITTTLYLKSISCVVDGDLNNASMTLEFFSNFDWITFQVHKDDVKPLEEKLSKYIGQTDINPHEDSYASDGEFSNTSLF